MAATIDHDFLRAKYRKERDKRLRPDGNDQYLEPTGKFAHFVDDPYVERVERAPIFDEVTVALIGGGFAGLCTGARLQQAGIDDVRIIEGGGDVGGAWYWNRYPGAMCDTAAMVYLPLLEETGHMPTQKYTIAPEIFGHAQRIAKQFGLYDNAIFSTQVTRLEWEPTRPTGSSAPIAATRSAPGSSRWAPGRCTVRSCPACRASRRSPATPSTRAGGTTTTPAATATGAPMTKLADKRVGIIGTGATAVQCIPPLARDAGELYVFQRTPSSIDVRDNHPIDPDWFATLAPGWQRKWLTNFATLQTAAGSPTRTWSRTAGPTSRSASATRDRIVDENPGSSSRPTSFNARVRGQRRREDGRRSARASTRSCRSAQTAEALKPWYRQLCKRPCFHDEYLQAYNEPARHLVDTDGKGVERIDETGVWVEAACTTNSTASSSPPASRSAPSYARRSGFETIGRDGEDALRALGRRHAQRCTASTCDGFPNLFIVGPNQGANLISNITHNLRRGRHDDRGGRRATRSSIGAHEVEVTAEAEAAWMQLLESNPRRSSATPTARPATTTTRASRWAAASASR